MSDGTNYMTPLGSQPNDLPNLQFLSRDLEDVAILIKQTKRSLTIIVKDIGTPMTEKEGQEYLKFARLLHHLKEFEGFNLSRKDRRIKTACFCCGDIDIHLKDSNFQQRGQKLFLTDWIKKPCPNHDRNKTCPSDDENPSPQQSL